MSDDRENPWRTLGIADVYDNPWIEVTEHQVITPAGTPGQYGKVRFKCQAVGVLPIDEEGHTWLVGQYRYPLDEYHWELPKGGSDPGEDFETTARRELAEETGLRAARFTRLNDTVISPSITDERGVVFVAEDLTAGAPDPEPTEALTVRRLPFAHVLAMAHSGEISDALSLIGIYRFAILRPELAR